MAWFRPLSLVAFSFACGVLIVGSVSAGEDLRAPPGVRPPPSIAPPRATDDDDPIAPPIESPPGETPPPAAAPVDLEILIPSTFAALDVNQDEELSGTETTGLLKFDTNGDKRISYAEFQNGMRALDAESRGLAEFQKLDGNEDGWLSGTEMRGLEKLDTNSDRRITQEEFLAGHSAEPAPPRALPAGEASYVVFLECLAAKDAKRMHALLHPGLQQDVDPIMLQFLFDVAENKLGAMDRDAKPEITSTEERNELGTFLRSTAAVPFSRGPLQCTASVQSGRFIQFSLDTEKLGDLNVILADRIGEDQGFADAMRLAYAPQGEKLLRHVFAGESEAAHSLFHPNIQTQIPLDKIENGFANVRNLVGPITKADCQSITVRADAAGSLQKVVLNFDLEGTKAKAIGQALFEIVGLRAWLTGVNANLKLDE